jgi:hypothetical protein
MIDSLLLLMKSISFSERDLIKGANEFIAVNQTILIPIKMMNK